MSDSEGGAMGAALAANTTLTKFDMSSSKCTADAMVKISEGPEISQGCSETS